MKQKCYIILVHYSNGIIRGFIENSFSMSISNDRVRVYRPYKYSKEFLKEKKYNSGTSALLSSLSKTVTYHNNKKENKDNNITYKIHRIGSDNCPVSINWNEIILMKKRNEYKKFNYRNLPFEIKNYK